MSDNEVIRRGDALAVPDYDAGLLNDYGGGNVDWWQDYLRAEIGRANDHWQIAIATLIATSEAVSRREGWNDAMDVAANYVASYDALLANVILAMKEIDE
jgi:hypothetical protein